MTLWVDGLDNMSHFHILYLSDGVARLHIYILEIQILYHHRGAISDENKCGSGCREMSSTWSSACLTSGFSKLQQEEFLFINVTLHSLHVFENMNYLSSTTEDISRGKSVDVTGGELASSILTAPQRRLLLIVAGDVERNPGPHGSE